MKIKTKINAITWFLIGGWTVWALTFLVFYILQFAIVQDRFFPQTTTFYYEYPALSLFIFSPVGNVIILAMLFILLMLVGKYKERLSSDEHKKRQTSA